MAAELEVDKRTIYRDIATLQAMRVPIQGEAGVGYVMRPGFDLPPLMFTADEVEAIAGECRAPVADKKGSAVAEPVTMGVAACHPACSF